MKTYRFECYDDEFNQTTTIEFQTEQDAWSGYDGPMMRFFDFLKGCGYCFDLNAMIGVVDENGEFIAAGE